MYGGPIFIATSATKTRTTRMMIRPMMLRPCCRLRICLASPASAERTEASQLVPVEPDEERAADDVLVGHESPSAAVARVVPVVAHAEVMARRHRARQAAHIVVA